MEDFMVQEVAKYRAKGYLISDKSVEHILRMCRMKMEISGDSSEEYQKELVAEQLKEYCFAQEANLISLKRLGANPDVFMALSGV